MSAMANVITELAIEALSDPWRSPEPFMPDPFMNLPKGIELALEALKLGPPPEIHKRLVAWIEQAESLLKAVDA